jgi:hypothetical protein
MNREPESLDPKTVASELRGRYTERRIGQAIKARIRRQEKREAREAFRSLEPEHGYRCPKCHALHPTPEARRECRASHHTETP